MIGEHSVAKPARVFVNFILISTRIHHRAHDHHYATSQETLRTLLGAVDHPLLHKKGYRHSTLASIARLRFGFDEGTAVGVGPEQREWENVPKRVPWSSSQVGDATGSATGSEQWIHPNSSLRFRNRRFGGQGSRGNGQDRPPQGHQCPLLPQDNKAAHHRGQPRQVHHFVQNTNVPGSPQCGQGLRPYRLQARSSSGDGVLCGGGPGFEPLRIQITQKEQGGVTGDHKRTQVSA